MSIIKNVLAATLVAASVSTVVAADWTEWEDYARGTFDAQWWYRKPMNDLQVMRRQQTSNPDMVQFKVCGMFGDTPGCAPVDLIIGANFAVEGPTSRDVSIWVDDQYIESYYLGDKKTDIYLCDGYTYYETYFPMNPDYAMQYEGASYYRPETGTFTIYSYYHYPNGDVPFLDAFYQDQAQGVETLRLIGPEFKNYIPDIANGRFDKDGDKAYYTCDVTLNDLSMIKMSIVPGSDVNARDIASKMDDNVIDYIRTENDGPVRVDFNGEAGDHTLVYLTYDADENAYQIGQIALNYDPDWAYMGTATFTDGFISKFLEGDMKNNMGLDLPEEKFTYPVEMEKSTTTPGRYRLVNPYGATSPYWDLDFSVLKINRNKTHYLYINASDPEKVHIEYSDCGFYYGSEPLVLYSEAHDWLEEGYAIDVIPDVLWGKMKDDVITFAAGDEENNLLAAKIMNSPASIYGRELRVVLPGASGVKGVSSVKDEAPIYYTLQGICVENPVNGLYIRRQGEKTEKVIIRNR